MLLALFLPVVAACRLAPWSGPEPEPPSGEALEAQALVMSVADDYIASLGEAIYLLARGGEPDPRSRALAQSFLRNGVGASIDIAAGPNPAVSLLDLLVLTSLQTWSFGNHWMPSGIGDAGAPALERLRQAEAGAWNSAREALTEDQLSTLRELVDTWIDENPDRTVVALVRFDEFSDSRKISSLALRSKASGLLREVGLATEAIEDARLFGERALWFTGRFLYLLGEQVELTTYRLADQPEGRQLLDTLQAVEEVSAAAAARLGDLEQEQENLFLRLSEERSRAVEQAQAAVTEVLGQTLSEAAERIRAERELALRQFFGALAEERTRLLDDLAAREEQLHGFMADLRETVVASDELARGLTVTVEAIDGVLARFDAADGERGGSLDLEDLAEAANEVRLAAVELTRLAEISNELVASEEWDRRFAHAVEPVNDTVDRAFRRGLVLIAVLVVGLGLMLLVVGLVLGRRPLAPNRRAGAA